LALKYNINLNSFDYAKILFNFGKIYAKIKLNVAKKLESEEENI
jgi:hypothetical protein